MDKAARKEDIEHIIDVFRMSSITSGGVFDVKISDALEHVDDHHLIKDPANSVLLSEFTRDESTS